MLGILLPFDGTLYAIDGRRIVEIVPMVALRPVASAPPHVRGFLDYRGRVVAVVDLCELVAGRPCRDRLDSRILIVEFPEDRKAGLLGLLAEGVVDTIRAEAAAPLDRRLEVAPHLGGVFRTELGLVQELVVDHILDPEVRAALAAGQGEAPAGEAGP